MGSETPRKPARAPRKAPVKAQATKTVATRKSELASALLDDAERLRSQLFAPVVVKKVVTVSTGQGYSTAEVVEVDLTEPTFADKKLIVTAIGTVVNRLSLLDTGAESSRTVRDELQAKRDARRSAAKVAAAPKRGG